jgi:tetratricopeptide (TPR) repeat protein
MSEWLLHSRKPALVSNHLCPEDLKCLVKGTLSRQRRREALRHLLRCCPVCSRALTTYGGFALDEIPEDAYDAVVARVTSQVSQLAVARREAVSTLTALLAGDRAWTDLSTADLALLRGLPRLGALLDAGWSLRHQDPQSTLRFARLARYAADRLDAKQLGAKPVADLRCLAWAELANAYRISANFPRATRAMNRAIYWLERGSQDSLLVVRVADLLASMLVYQRRWDEAKPLYQMVYQTHLNEGRYHLAGRTLIGASLPEPPEKALLMLRRGLNLLDLDRDPILVGQTLHTMIWRLADMGRFRTARRLLWRSRVLVDGAVAPLRVRWLEGKVYAGLGDFGRAEETLKAVRNGYAEQEQVYPAAMAGLDLAAVWARQGRVDQIYELAQEMIATFRALRVAREAVVTLLILQRACLAGGGQVLEIIDIVGSFLRELEEQPPARRQRPVED